MSDCCTRPPDAEPVIQADSKQYEYFVLTIAGDWSGSRGGWWDVGIATFTESWSGTFSHVYTKSHTTGAITHTFSGTHTWTRTITYLSGPDPVITRSATWTVADYSYPAWIFGSGDEGINFQQIPAFFSGAEWPYSQPIVVTSDLRSAENTVRTVNYNQRDGAHTIGSGTYTETLSDLDTIPYPETFASTPVASNGLASGIGYAVKNDINWRVRHDPHASCYLKAWLRKTFQPTTGSPVVTDLDPHVWEGVGTPCLLSPFLPPDDPANTILSAETEELAPEESGDTTISILKFSYLPAYTPPDDGSANGYPVPS